MVAGACAIDSANLRAASEDLRNDSPIKYEETAASANAAIDSSVQERDKQEGMPQEQKSEATREDAIRDRHAFGILPNLQTADENAPFQAMTSKEKLKLATSDVLDWSSFMLAAGFAGLGQMQNQNPAFGQGTAGYAKRFAGAYGDQAIGNMLAMGVLPSLTHEDPRYFWRGTGSGWSRAGYALSRIFVTRTDSGGSRFNTSEILGNALATGIANAYYPDGRNLQDNLVKFGTQLATDAFTTMLREFWPDIKRHLHKGHHQNLQPPSDH